MDRKLITAKIIDLLDARLKDVKESLKQNEELMRQSPTAMESHSDTSRFQFGQLADNLRVLAGNIENVIKEIKTNQGTTECVAQGSIIQIERNGNKLYYYIASMGLGESFWIDEEEFRVIAINTPIAQCLFGNKIGDDVEIKIPSGNYFIKIIGIN